MKKNKIIWILDDQPIFTSSLSKLIKDFGDFEVFEFNDPVNLIENLKGGGDQPNLLILDINMPQMNGLDVIKSVKSKYSEIRMLALSMYNTPVLISRIILEGADAFVCKSDPPNKLEIVIREILQYDYAYSKSTIDLMREHINSNNSSKKSRFEKNFLSKREKDVLIRICQQKKNSEIAGELFISERTVEGHRFNLIQKTNSRNAIGLVLYAINEGIVDFGILDVTS